MEIQCFGTFTMINLSTQKEVKCIPIRMSYVLLKKENKNNKRNTNGGEIFQICLNSIVPLFGEVGPCASKGILKEYSSEK